MKTNAFENGISEHHKIISNIMKHHFRRASPKTSYYRDYRKFGIDYVWSELSRQLDSTFCSVKENEDCEELFEFSRFHRVLLNLLNIHAPLKIFFQSYSSFFMTKTLRKAIIIRSRQNKSVNKTRSDVTQSLQKTQRNFCTKLLRKN